MAAANATIAALKVSLGLDSAQFTTGLRDASVTMQREAKKQAAAAAELERRVVSLKSSLDPVYAAQKRVGDQMKEAQALYKAGALSGAEYGKAMGELTSRLRSVTQAQTSLAGAQRTAEQSSKALGQAGLNLGRQFADVGVSLKGGISPLTVLIQQGPQIADAFAQAKQQGLGFGTVVKDLATSAGKFLATWGPVIAIGGAVAGVFLLWQKHLADTKEALKATAEATKNLGEVQASTRDALSAAVEFADKYRLTNLGLAKSLDDVLISQNAAYKETLAGIDANDAAGRSAARRAEIERLLTVSILKRAAAEATSRAKESEAAAKKARGPAKTTGFLVGFGLAGDPLALQEAAAAEAAKFKALGGDAAKKAAAEELAYAKALNASADALLKAKLIAPQAAEAIKTYAGAAGRARVANDNQTKSTEDLDRALQALLRSLETGAERELREYNEKTLLLRLGLDAGKISADQFRDAIDRLNPVVNEAAQAQEAFRGQLDKTPADIKPARDAVVSLREQFRSLADSFDDVAFSFGGIIGAFKTGNFSRLIDDVMMLKDGIASLLSQGGLSGLLSAGSAIATTIGGRGGRAVGGALGIASAGIGLGAFAGTAAGGAALGAAGLGAGAIAGVAALAPPLAVAAAALYAAVKLFNLGGKPSNAGAGVSLVTGEITGKSRTAETEEAARAAADAIKAGQDALKEAGVTLGATVHGLVVGTRDLSQVYLTNGRTVTAAIGDVAAAVDAGLNAVIEVATFTSDAQRRVAESAIAAGKGFDGVLEALNKYQAAQNIGQALADQILQLVNPQQYDTEAVRREIEAQRKAFADLAAEGYLTTEQLASLTAQLSELEALRLKDILERYATDVIAVEPPAPEEPANDNTLETLASATSAAAGMLQQAYQTFAQAKQAEINDLRQAADGLKAFRRELLLGTTAGRSPTSQLDLLRREFARISALPATDPERLANLQGVGQAFIEASRQASPNDLAFRRDIGAVRRLAEASEIAATAQADLAQQQLDTQTQMLTELGLLNTTSMEIATALQAFLAAQTNERAAGGIGVPNFDAAAYLAANADLGENWLAGGSLRGAGATLEEAALAHYMTTGQYEVAAGGRARGFASGGSFKVGGPGGIDSQLMQFWASPGEMVSVSHGDPQAGMSAGIDGLRQQVDMLTGAVVQLTGFARRSEKFMRKWDGDGLPAERDVA